VLAATHCLSIEAHAGAPMADVIGELAVNARPLFHQVLRNDQKLYFEPLGKLSKRHFVGCWVNHLFPFKTPRGKVQQVGVLAVEVTALRTLELYTNLTSQLHRSATENQVHC
jgi:hypothetical protein